MVDEPLKGWSDPQVFGPKVSEPGWETERFFRMSREDGAYVVCYIGGSVTLEGTDIPQEVVLACIRAANFDNSPAPNDADPVHGWFELTYSSYLVLARTMLQSMPTVWQLAFVSLIEEMRDAIGHHQKEGNYRVTMHDPVVGKFRTDPLADYQRGRRLLSFRKDYDRGNCLARLKAVLLLHKPTHLEH